MWEPEYPGPCFDLYSDRLDRFIFEAEKLFENVCATEALREYLFSTIGRLQATEHSLSREGRPSSPHTTVAGAICALYSEFFTSEPLKSGLCRPQAALLSGLRRACNSGDGRL